MAPPAKFAETIGSRSPWAELTKKLDWGSMTDCERFMAKSDTLGATMDYRWAP